MNPYASTAPLSKIQLSVSPGDSRVRQGTPLQIRASFAPSVDDARAMITWDDGVQESVAMAHGATNVFVLDLRAVAQGFRYSVQAGDAESPRYTVSVDVPPQIGAVRLVVESPAYTRWTNRVVQGGSADFLLGSRVRVVVEAENNKLAEAWWVPEGFPNRQFQIEANRLTLQLQPTNTLNYQLRLVGANQLTTESVQRWTLRPLADEPPAAHLELTGLDRDAEGLPASPSDESRRRSSFRAAGLVERDEVLPLRVSARDDVGLKSVKLLVLAGDSDAEVKDVFPNSTSPGSVPSRELSTDLPFNLADLTVLTGDEVQFQVLATDLLDQVTRSDPLTILVGSADLVSEGRAAERLKRMLSALDLQLDYLRQTRTSWLSLARNYREDDPGPQGPALVLLRSRLQEFGESVAGVGDWLVRESETNGLAEARFMYRFGSTVAAWARQQRAVLVGNCARLAQPGLTNANEIFNQGRELFSLALTDLEQYRQVLGILQGVLETDILAMRCESAQGRYKRGLAVMRGQDNVIAPLAANASGLLATFCEGIDLRGRILEQKIDLPQLDNYAPANHRDQWSCRYEGEILIPEAGDWTIACVADDGVRLLVAGKSLLPAEAWAPHPATQYQADLALGSGWQPLVIEFFQGYSESKLRLLIGKKGQALKEIAREQLRPPSRRRADQQLTSRNPAFSEIVKQALNQRVRNSLDQVSSVPPTLVPMTNLVQNETLTRAVTAQLPIGAVLQSNLATFTSWEPQAAQQAETQADGLTALSKDARAMLRAELEKYRWRYEGVAALKEMQNAVQELRTINDQLRRQPHNPQAQRTEEEQAKINLAKAWEMQLAQASTAAAYRFFQVAKQRQATLTERTLALRAAAKTEQDLPPVLEKLAQTLDQSLNKDELANQVETRLNEITDRYRELNDLQEAVNREQVAAEARSALPNARAFARAQTVPDDAGIKPKYAAMKTALVPVVIAQRMVGDYQGAARLESAAGESLPEARGKETVNELSNLAQRTDNHPVSLAETIPPPMQQQTLALEKKVRTPQESAEVLAMPRLAMSLEAARLNTQGDPNAAIAYELLGLDTGALLASPAQLTASALRPLADRAAALARLKGEAARQSEINAAVERFKQMAGQASFDAEMLGVQLDQLSGSARQAADDVAKRPTLTSQLNQTASWATPVTDWTGATEPRQIAASAAHESLGDIQVAPQSWEAYNSASQILAEAARQIRMAGVLSQIGDLNPFPLPQTDTPVGFAVSARGSSGETRQSPALVESVPKGLDQAEWARLNERLRQAIRSSGIEHFTAEQQIAIRAYFERLSSSPGK